MENTAEPNYLWRDIAYAPHVHGKRIFAQNADVGEFAAEWFEGKGWVYSWNQEPCNPSWYMDIPPLLKPPFPQESKEAYFITSKEYLSEESYQRLKNQIDTHWPRNLPRPILLEGCQVVKL